MADMDIMKSACPLVDCGTGSVNTAKLVEILNENGIYKKIKGVNVVVEPELPVHFTSICKFVTVQFIQDNQVGKLSNNQQQHQSAALELFVKKLKENAEIKEEDEYSLFEKESNLYTQVMPALRHMCESRTGLVN